MIINATNIGRRLSGIGRYSLSLGKQLLSQWDYPFQLFINKNASAFFQNSPNKEKIRIVGPAVSPDNGLKGHALRLLWTNALCLKNPGTVVFNTSQLEGPLFHSKGIMTVHDLIPLQFPQYHGKQIYYFKYVLPRLLKKALRIITVSEHTKQLLMQLYGIREKAIVVIHNGIPDDFLHCTAEPSKQNYILYAGRVSPTKNIGRLFEAFKQLITTYKLDVTLKLTDNRHAADFPIDGLLRDKIEFTGNISDKDLMDLYKHASLFVFPSFCEGFGLPPLEAMACGCPAVVSNVASLPEVCGDAAYYIDPYNIENMADGMYRVLSDAGLRQGLVEKGLERVKKFTWESSAKQHIRVFEEVLQS